ncbi:MAG: exopolyphosphatase [Halothiobacillus sp. 14-56-357]|jgi:exopolyphosphatase/guanosine-5'-triphosphate,3'-diphosphate pyrophosphatase|uniref:exopolyphosphatase n=1 Tax=Halothiobacillus sp. 15-55-196 TaxID=1970382 RepID=UPI000BCEB27B|nr:exopolyphosphatase [Halothiobacillus sp. 15-55-196]OZB37671.1 MAG: exopolyphosphatase [Halothiobacillus sp. 15-55-196]OZB55099.1 MAG: exopolyphosphatase [Halothiobacillus sp. 14-56-357]OZB79419.1 MAG: exopolyphosphatase [Halothiobacillus sp. 13-55-115]
MMQNDSLVAAVDLGSNSFHMLIARVSDGQVQVIDRMKEMVRLAGGLQADGSLAEEAMERGVACLTRFGQRVSGMPRGSVRIVGTNTLRAAKNGAEFIKRGEKAIGHPIEIIAGREEARLVYLGVSRSEIPIDGDRLVVDIGGGSTELILGKGITPFKMESVPIGCVALMRDFFPDGVFDAARLEHAKNRAELELSPYKMAYLKSGWTQAMGSSGTARSLATVIKANGWGDGAITKEGLARIQAAVLKAGSLSALKLSGLSEDRKPVFVGGLIAMQAIFAALEIKQMLVSDGALREGLVFDWLDRDDHDDIRIATVRRLQRLFTVDVRHADRVAKTAADLLAQVAPAWGLDCHPESIDAPRYAVWLDIAARLHEIGLAVSHSGFHHHGAYILSYADMPGLTRPAQMIIASLVHTHRRKFKLQRFDEVDERLREQIVRLSAVLRLAVLLHRDRSPRPNLSRVKLEAGADNLHVSFPDGWLKTRPLTRVDLELEQSYLAMANIRLSFA